MIVDPGMDAEPVLDEVEKQGLKVTLPRQQRTATSITSPAMPPSSAPTGAPLAIHRDDLPMLRLVRAQAALYGLEAEDSPETDLLLAEAPRCLFDGDAFDVLHTRGPHARRRCACAARQMIVGDTLFHGAQGGSYGT
jgi:hypothetical protein